MNKCTDTFRFLFLGIPSTTMSSTPNRLNDSDFVKFLLNFLIYVQGCSRNNYSSFCTVVIFHYGYYGCYFLLLVDWVSKFSYYNFCFLGNYLWKIILSALREMSSRRNQQWLALYLFDYYLSKIFKFCRSTFYFFLTDILFIGFKLLESS